MRNRYTKSIGTLESPNEKSVIIEPDSCYSQWVTPDLCLAPWTLLYMSCHILAHLNFTTIGFMSGISIAGVEQRHTIEYMQFSLGASVLTCSPWR